MQSHILSRSIMCACALFTVALTGHAQSTVPDDASSVLNLSLDDGQAQLQKAGYEIADSSLSGRKQLWWNESQKACVELEFDKSEDKKITSVSPGKEKKCIKGVEASRKVWANYRDGQAPASAPALDAERSKLSGQGYKASYWINDVSPGKNAETWYNASANTCKRIIWSAADNQNVKAVDCKPEQGTNPAPK